MKLLPTSTSQKLETLRGNIYFEGLDEAALETVTKSTHLHQFERGENIFFEGEPSAGLHIMAEGSVKLYRLSPQGREYIVNILVEGDTFNEVSVYSGGTNPVNVAALEESTIWVIKVGALRELGVVPK